MQRFIIFAIATGADPGEGCTEMTCGFLIQLVFCEKKTMWFIGVEVEQETSATPPKNDPGSAPVLFRFLIFIPSIIPIRTFVFVNFVLCSLFFFLEIFRIYF